MSSGAGSSQVAAAVVRYRPFLLAAAGAAVSLLALRRCRRKASQSNTSAGRRPNKSEGPHQAAGIFKFEAEVPRVSVEVDEDGTVSVESAVDSPSHILVPLHLQTEEDDDLEGSIVWQVSILLARLLLDDSKYPHKFFHPKRTFIELGCGCGLPGMAAALRGAKVTFTDMAPVLPRLMRNIEANLKNIPLRLPDVAATLPLAVQASEQATAAQLDWLQIQEDLQAGHEDVPYDVVLVADCVYQEQLVQPLVDTILAVTGPKSVVLLTLRARFDFQAKFLAELNVWFSGMPLNVEERHLKGLVGVDDIYALRLKRRKTPLDRA